MFLREQIVLSPLLEIVLFLIHVVLKVTNFSELSLERSLSIFRLSSEEFKLGNVYKSLFDSLFRIAHPRLRLHARK